MDLDASISKGETHEVHASGPQGPRKCAHMTAFAPIDGIYRIAGPADGAHLDGHASPVIDGEEVDLTTFDLQVPIQDRHALRGEPPGCQMLPGHTQRKARVDQMEISVFSNFSTFTSRKVRTRTVSRNRAGRNMSHTQASLMITSK